MFSLTYAAPTNRTHLGAAISACTGHFIQVGAPQREYGWPRALARLGLSKTSYNDAREKYGRLTYEAL